MFSPGLQIKSLKDAQTIQTVPADEHDVSAVSKIHPGANNFNIDVARQAMKLQSFLEDVFFIQSYSVKYCNSLLLCYVTQCY